MAPPDALRAAPPPRRDTPGSPRALVIVGMLVVLMALNYADKLAFGLAAKPIIEEFGLTLGEFGFASSAFYLPFFLSTLVVGFAANRTNSTWLLGTIAVLWGVAQISMVFASGLAVIVASRLLLGASEGPTYGLVNHASFTWLRDRDRGLASSLLSAGGSLGVMASAPLLTWLIVDHGWRAAFIASGLASVVWCLVWVFVGREGPLARRVQAERPAEDRPATPDAAESDPPTGPAPSFWRVVTTPSFIAVSLAAFAGNWAIAVGLAFKPLYAADVLHLTEHQISLFIVVGQVFTTVAVYIGLGSLMRHLAGRGVPARLSRGVLGGVCVLVAGVAFIGFVFAPGLYPKLACSVVGGIGLIAFPVGSTVISQITPASRRAGVLGTYAAIYGTAGIIAPWATGLIAEQAATQEAGLNNAFVFWGALTLVCGAVALVHTRPERDARRLGVAAPPVAAG